MCSSTAVAARMRRRPWHISVCMKESEFLCSQQCACKTHPPRRSTCLARGCCDIRSLHDLDCHPTRTGWNSSVSMPADTRRRTTQSCRRSARRPVHKQGPVPRVRTCCILVNGSCNRSAGCEDAPPKPEPVDAVGGFHCCAPSRVCLRCPRQLPNEPRPYQSRPALLATASCRP